MVPYMQFNLFSHIPLFNYLPYPSILKLVKQCLQECSRKMLVWIWWMLGARLRDWGPVKILNIRHRLDKKGHRSLENIHIKSLVSEPWGTENPTIQCVAGLFPGCGCSTGVTTWLCHVSLDLQGESDGRMWHMKVHTNRRTNIGSNKHFNPIFLPGLLLEAYVGGSSLISFECSSVSGTFPKVVTQACLRCLHIRGHLPCSNPIFFSSAFTKQLAVAFAFSGAVWCSKSTSQPG